MFVFSKSEFSCEVITHGSMRANLHSGVMTSNSFFSFVIFGIILFPVYTHATGVDFHLDFLQYTKQFAFGNYLKPNFSIFLLGQHFLPLAYSGSEISGIFFWDIVPLSRNHLRTICC